MYKVSRVAGRLAAWPCPLGRAGSIVILLTTQEMSYVWKGSLIACFQFTQAVRICGTLCWGDHVKIKEPPSWSASVRLHFGMTPLETRVVLHTALFLSSFPSSPTPVLAVKLLEILLSLTPISQSTGVLGFQMHTTEFNFILVLDI